MSKLMRNSKNDEGFTMLEGALSIMLLSITAIGLYTTVIFAQNAIVDARHVTEATNFARRKLEKIMDTDFLMIPQNYIASRNYDANPFDSQYFETDPDGDYASTLPNSRWQVEYFYPSSGIDPLVIRLTVFWMKSGSSEPEHQIQFSTKLTAGRI